MRKKIPKIFTASIMLLAIYLLTVPKESIAQTSDWQYASVSYFETELLNGYNPCVWVATECSSDVGTSCTTPGSKSRGLVYCLLPTFENFK